MAKRLRKHPIKMFVRMARLLLFGANRTDVLVEKSYDRISSGFDKAWTNHMRGLSEELIGRLGLKEGDRVLDLACGTGAVTAVMAEKTGEKVVGVDKSEGMLEQARKNYGQSCEFVNADVLEFLKTAADNSYDVVTCFWGLGYSRPYAVLREVERVLKPGGRVGVIDNSIFSLAEVLYCSFLAFMEQPAKLANIMRFTFLLGRRHLGLWWRILGMKPVKLWHGKKSYKVSDGASAIERLRATGAAAGFEYAAEAGAEDEIYERFAQIIERKYMKDDGIEITHRYLAGIAQK